MNGSEPAPHNPIARRILARLIVALILGVFTGWAMGASVASDAARGRSLTIKEYLADFDDYRKHLIGNDVPMWAAIIMGILVLVIAVGVYELLVWVVDKTLGVTGRRS